MFLVKRLARGTQSSPDGWCPLGCGAELPLQGVEKDRWPRVSDDMSGTRNSLILQAEVLNPLFRYPRELENTDAFTGLFTGFRLHKAVIELNGLLPCRPPPLLIRSTMRSGKEVVRGACRRGRRELHSGLPPGAPRATPQFPFRARTTQVLRVLACAESGQSLHRC